MVLWAIAEHWGADLGARRRGQASRAGPALRKAGAVVLAMVVVYPLAAIQVWPTARLAALAASGAISSISPALPVTPFHLVNACRAGIVPSFAYLETLVWDPLHAMPEECLTYIGLVPLFLALMTVVARVSPRSGRPAPDDPRPGHPDSESGSLRTSDSER